MNRTKASCLWCEHSQVRHGALHCGIDIVNLETSSDPPSSIARRCPFYEFDPAKYALLRRSGAFLREVR